MKISVKQLVILFLGLFLLKIAVADPYRETKKKRRSERMRKSPTTFIDQRIKNS